MFEEVDLHIADQSALQTELKTHLVCSRLAGCNTGPSYCIEC